MINTEEVTVWMEIKESNIPQLRLHQSAMQKKTKCFLKEWKCINQEIKIKCTLIEIFINSLFEINRLKSFILVLLIIKNLKMTKFMRFSI
jgi:hypothetical protein